jgi:hypothetical protein
MPTAAFSVGVDVAVGISVDGMGVGISVGIGVDCAQPASNALISNGITANDHSVTIFSPHFPLFVALIPLRMYCTLTRQNVSI